MVEQLREESGRIRDMHKHITKPGGLEGIRVGALFSPRLSIQVYVTDGEAVCRSPRTRLFRAV